MVAQWLLAHEGAMPFSAFCEAVRAGAGVKRLYASSATAAALLGHERGYWRASEVGGELRLDDGRATWDDTGQATPARRAGACYRCGEAEVAKAGERRDAGREERWALCAGCYCKPATAKAGIPRPTHRFSGGWTGRATCKWCGATQTEAGRQGDEASALRGWGGP